MSFVWWVSSLCSEPFNCLAKFGISWGTDGEQLVKALEEEIEETDRSPMYMYIPLCSKAVAYKEAWNCFSPVSHHRPHASSECKTFQLAFLKALNKDLVHLPFKGYR